ncbi:hypothetical protein JCM10213v2_000554 [Rhodosporidiobolus nylandii]
MAPLALDSLKLVLLPPDDPDSDEEDYGGYTEEGSFIKAVICEVKAADGRVLGRLRMWLIDLIKCEEEGESFFLWMDDEDAELSDFAATVFETDGKVKRRFSREGTGVWGREVGDSFMLCYLEELRIGREYRNQGIGTWALQQSCFAGGVGLTLTRANRVIALDLAWSPAVEAQAFDRVYRYRADQECAGDVDFVFAMPCSLHSEFPDNPNVTRASVDPHAAEKDEMSKRVAGSFRRSGFRRIGISKFFCYARDPSHPSRMVSPEHDADEVTTAAERAGVHPGDVKLFEVVGEMYGLGGRG